MTNAADQQDLVGDVRKIERVEAGIDIGSSGLQARRRDVEAAQRDVHRIVEILLDRGEALLMLILLDLPVAGIAEQQLVTDAEGVDLAGDFGAPVEVRIFLIGRVGGRDRPDAGREVYLADIGDHALAARAGIAGLDADRPIITQRIIGAAERVGHPCAVGCVDRRIAVVRAGDGGKRDVPLHRGRERDAARLVGRAPIILDVELEGEPIGRAPVEGAAHHIAIAVDTIDRRFDARAIGVDAHADPLVWSELPPDVETAADAALVVAIHIHAGHGRGTGALGDDVDDARRRADPVIERGHALQQLNALLVLDRDGAEIDDLQRAVQAVVGPRVHQHAPRDEVVAGGRAGRLLRDSGRVAERFLQPLRTLRVEERSRHH